MWITLPLAAMTTVGLGARGRPWHGIVAGTFGIYLAGATWSLMANGTGGFMETVTSDAWWLPAGILGAGALVTGVPAIRRSLFGRAAWRHSRTHAQQQQPEASTPDWQRVFLDKGLVDPSAAWNAAAATLIDESALVRRARTRGRITSMEHRVSGVLGQAIQTMDHALMGLPSSAISSSEGMAADTWAKLLSLGPEAESGAHSVGQSGSESGAGLSVTDRAELVLRAASHSMDAALALGWRWFSGIEPIIEHLGTDQQRSELLPHLADAAKTLAAGWSGAESSPSSAIVVQETRDGEDVFGLRVTCEITGVVGASAATTVALMVSTTDPHGLLASGPGASGPTCVLVSLQNERSVLDGAGLAEQLAAQLAGHASTGTVSLQEVFVPLDDVVGGAEGIGAVGHMLARRIAGAAAVRDAALLAGQAQRQAAIRGSAAILGNVMSAETIEAWAHADLGASTLSLTALAKAAALVLEERIMTLSEARAFRTAAERLALDLQDSPATAASNGTPHELGADPSKAQAANEPSPQRAWLADSPAGWEASWQHHALQAVLSESPRDFDMARARGLRESVSTGLRSWLQSMVERVPGVAARRTMGLGTAFARLARAHALVRTLAARKEHKGGASSVLNTHLRHAEERWTVCLSMTLLDRLGGHQPNEQPFFEFAVLSELSCIFTDLTAAVGQIRGPLPRLACRAALRAASPVRQGPPPHLAETVAASFAATPEMLHRLTAESFRGRVENGGTAPILEASRLAASSRVPIASIQRAQALGQLPDDEFSSVLDLAVTRRIASAADVARIRSCMAVASAFLSNDVEDSPDQAERLSA